MGRARCERCGIVNKGLDKKGGEEMGTDRNIWRAGPGRGHRVPMFPCPWCGERFHSVFKANAHMLQCSKEVKKGCEEGKEG